LRGADGLVVRRSNLPRPAQLEMHVDVPEFIDLVHGAAGELTSSDQSGVLEVLAAGSMTAGWNTAAATAGALPRGEMIPRNFIPTCCLTRSCRRSKRARTATRSGTTRTSPPGPATGSCRSDRAERPRDRRARRAAGIIIDDPLKPQEVIASAAPGGERVVRPHPLQATER